MSPAGCALSPEPQPPELMSRTSPGEQQPAVCHSLSHPAPWCWGPRHQTPRAKAAKGRASGWPPSTQSRQSLAPFSPGTGPPLQSHVVVKWGKRLGPDPDTTTLLCGPGQVGASPHACFPRCKQEK